MFAKTLLAVGAVAALSLSACGGGGGDSSDDVPLGTPYWRVVEYRPGPTNQICISECTVRTFPTIYYSLASCKNSADLKAAVSYPGNYMECQETIKQR